MAQDFGDDIGDILVRAFGRACKDAYQNRKSKHLHDEYKRIFEKNGMSKDDAAAKAEAMASREHICIPFGSSVDATYFARVLQENDIAAAAMSDAKGNGYVEFAKAEIENVKQYIPQFSEVMTALKEEQIAKVLDGTPVSEDVYNSLKPIYLRPDLPKTQTKEPESHDIAEDGHVGPADEAPEHVHDDRVNDAYHHTNGIRDKVLAAREQCRDFDDFKELLAKEEVGVTESKSGELMFYEARRDENGEILPHGENENGLMDWSVGAKALRDRYGCDVTHDWFEKNTPKEPTAPEHDSAREVIPPQKDLNLICNAVRGDLKERGIETRDRSDGKMGFHVDNDYEQQVVDAVENRFPGHTPEELGIILDPHHDRATAEPDISIPDITEQVKALRANLERQGIETYDTPEGDYGFAISSENLSSLPMYLNPNIKIRVMRPEAVPLEKVARNDAQAVGESSVLPQVTDGSLDMNGSTPDINQGIESHDGMDTMVNTLRIEREQNGTEVSPSMVREQSDRSREKYDLNSQAKECRAASKQLSQTNDSPDRDISDKFQQER